jgi:hypothetical protein
VTEDDLRAVFAERAAAVPPPEDLLDGVRNRVRRTRRLRGLAVASLVVACAAAFTPAMLPHRAAPALARTADRAAPGEPSNLLTWPARGRPLPHRFDAAVTAWLARDAAHHGGAAGRVRRHLLWSGALPDGRWAALTQVWNPTDARHAHAWSTVLFTARRDGRHLSVPYDLPTRFTHEGRGGSGAGVARISGYGFDLGDAVVVVGAPAASRAALANSGHTVTRPLTAGAAVFPVRPHGRTYDLFRLTGSNGARLTPDDRHTGPGHGWHLDLTR